MPKPVIAIIGRPNVGKSSLFNRIAGKRLSIVEDTPGVTRDRLYTDAEWTGKEFSLVDTGGIEPRADSEILKFMRMQAELAIDHADVIIFVTDIKTGITASDTEVAQMLLKSKKPIVLAVNKVDTPGTPPAELYEFYNLGLGDPMPISALHGYSSGDLLDECFKHIPDDFNYEEEEENIKVCVIGKPNVGKSSLINKVLGENRVIVSDVAGTTRDSVDTYVENDFGKFTFIDTAGIRKRSKVDESIERYSVVRAVMAIERADVVLIMINAEEGVTEQDTKIAGEAHNRGKAAIILVNKWDLIEKDGKTMDEYTAKIRHDLIYMPYAPIMFISAETGQRVHKLFEKIAFVNEQTNIRITTGQLNSVLAEATSRVQPPSDKGKRLKIYYMTQAGVKPPTFIMFCNEAQLFHFSYRRYIENQLRAVYKLEGTPIKMIIRQKGEDGDK
ncbi:MAG: ribosome biogenesis GTPase Der [Clostridia bacterium]